MTRRDQAIEAVRTLTGYRRWLTTPHGQRVTDWCEQFLAKSFPGNTAPNPDEEPLVDALKTITATAPIFAVGPEMAAEVVRLSRDIPAHSAMSAEDLGSATGWIHFAEPVDFAAGYSPDEFPVAERSRAAEQAARQAPVYRQSSGHGDPMTREVRALAWKADEIHRDGLTFRRLRMIPFCSPEAWVRWFPEDSSSDFLAIYGSSPIIQGASDVHWTLSPNIDSLTPGNKTATRQLDAWDTPDYAAYRALIVLAAMLSGRAFGEIYERVDRATRRRAERAGIAAPSPDGAGIVRIVDLPRRTRTADDDSGQGEPTGPLEYRTPVGGHLKSQPYGPGRKLRKVIWVAPYVRGEGLPDQPGHTVYRTD